MLAGPRTCLDVALDLACLSLLAISLHYFCPWIGNPGGYGVKCCDADRIGAHQVVIIRLNRIGSGDGVESQLGR